MTNFKPLKTLYSNYARPSEEGITGGLIGVQFDADGKNRILIVDVEFVGKNANSNIRYPILKTQSHFNFELPIDTSEKEIFETVQYTMDKLKNFHPLSEKGEKLEDVFPIRTDNLQEMTKRDIGVVLSFFDQQNSKTR